MENFFNLTNSQKTFIYDEEMFPESSKRMMGGLLVIDTEIDIELLIEAVKKSIAEHDNFRLKFVKIGNEYKQTILDDVASDIKVVDFSSSENPFEEAIKYTEKRKKEIIKYDETPLFENEFLLVNPKLTIWFTRFHHLICDGWGWNVYQKNVYEIYESLLTTSYEFTERPSFRQSLDIENKYFTSKLYQKSEIFWKDEFKKPIQKNKLLAASPDSFESLDTSRITIHNSELFKNTIDRIVSDYDSQKVHIYMATLALIFSKIYNTDEVIIGTPVLNRLGKKAKNITGLFMNVIPIRIHIDYSWTFEELLHQINLKLKACYRHSSYPFSEIMRIIKQQDPDLELPYCVSLVNRVGEFKFNCITLDPESRLEPFSLEIDDYNSDLPSKMFFSFRNDIFSEEEKDLIVSTFQYIIMNFADEDEPLSSFQIFPYNKLPYTNYDIERNYRDLHPKSNLLNKISLNFESKKNQYAFISSGKKLTYQQFNDYTDILAENLVINYKVDSQSVISVMCKAKHWMPLMLIACWKIRAIYLPLDPNNPASRTQSIINDSNANVLITDIEDTNYEISTIEPDDLLTPIDKSHETFYRRNLEENDLAYMIYTSGTTGNPKGVLIEHTGINDSVNNFISGIKTEFQRFLWYASPAFDASIIEMMIPLCSGKTLYAVSEDEKMDIKKYSEFVDKYNIDSGILTPALLDVLPKDCLKKFSLIITAGEKPNPQAIDTYCKNLDYYNAYGPTEVSIGTNITKLDSGSYVHVGKALEHLSMVIIDEFGNTLPQNIKGEIAFIGSGLAKGYYNKPNLTNEKFCYTEDGIRYYKTGDLGWIDENGNLFVAERVDHQMKINGYRVEAGEIERAIESDSCITKCYVKQIDRDSGKRLVAFCTYKSEVDADRLKLEIQTLIPRYMVPDDFLFFDEFPTTLNGKIDYKKMEMKLSPDSSYEKNAIVENEIADVWKDVLNVKSICNSDNFYSLGGNSLKAMQICHILNGKGYESEYITLFKNPIFGDFCKKIVKLDEQIELPKPMTSCIKKSKLSKLQYKIWLGHKKSGKNNIYNMPCAFIVNGALTKSKLEDTFRKILIKYPILTIKIVEENGEVFQEISNPDHWNICEEKNYNEKMLPDYSNIGFDLDKDFLFRVHAWFEDNRTILFLNIHHLIADGISISVILNDFSKLFGSDIEMKRSENDFMSYISINQTKQVKRESDHYWKLKKLNSNPETLFPLINDNRHDNYSGAYRVFDLNNSIWNDVQKYCINRSVSVFTFFEAVVKVILFKYTGRNDLSVATSVSIRDSLETSSMVGLLIKMLPIISKIKDDTPFNNFLKFEDENIKFALSNKDSDLDEIFGENIDLLSEVIIQYQKSDLFNLTLEGFDVTQLNFDYPVSKFKLSWNFFENDGEMKFMVGYNLRYFDEDFCNQISKHFVNLIKSILEDDNTICEELTYLSKTDLDFKQNNLNEMQSDNVFNLWDKLNEYAESKPNEPAIVDSNRSITWKELQERVLGVSNRLKRYEPEASSTIPLHTNRSIDMIIGMLGILQSGNAYSPIDPDLPLKRKKEIISELDAKLVFSNIEFLVNNCDILDLKHVSKTDGSLSNVDPKSNAYVLFTSGSTGKPKGVIIRNENLENLVNGLQEFYLDNCIERTALVAPYYFDASIKTIFPSLTFGKTLYVTEEETRLNGVELAIFLDKNKINLCDATPAHLQMMSLSEGIDLQSMQTILVGGEALKPEIVESFVEKVNFSKSKIINVYGPTECTDVVAYYRLEDKYYTRIPIGRSLRNCNLKVVNRWGQELSRHIPGELIISGEQVGSGYWKNKNLTNTQFENDFYKTGDVVYRGCDDNIYFAGRKDKQLKLNGFRIEPEEIETKLRQFPEIDSAIVDKVTDLNGNNQLTAWIVKREQNCDYTVSQVIGNDIIDENLLKKAMTCKKSIKTFKALDDYDRERYKRQMMLDQWNEGSQERLKSATVFVAGAGGIGSPVLMQLALLGVGNIIITDFDEVDLSNLNRQFMHNDSRIGMNKAESAKLTIQQTNPKINVIVHKERITRDNIKRLVANADLIFDCVDDLETKFVLSECAVDKSIPHILMVMMEINSYVSILHPPFSPCLKCIYDFGKMDEIKEMKSSTNYRKSLSNPVSAPALFACTGFAMNEAIKIIAKTDKPAYGKFFLFNQKASESITDALGYQILVYPFSKYFKEQCNDSGFSWDLGFSGKILEEIDVTADPNCSQCSTLADKHETQNANIETDYSVIVNLYDNTQNQDIAKAFSLLGVNSLILDKCYRNENVFQEYNVRQIITDKLNYDNWKEFIESYNSNIDVMIWENLAFSKIEQTENKGIIQELVQNDIGIFELNIKDSLKESLPKYLIPQNIVTVDKFPLTANGKIDLKTLANMGTSSNKPKVEPTTDNEKYLHDLWCELLNRNSIGITDDFFTIGGNSIIAVQMVFRIEKEQGVKLKIGDIFNNPVIKDLAKLWTDKKSDFVEIDICDDEIEFLDTEDIEDLEKWGI